MGRLTEGSLRKMEKRGKMGPLYRKTQGWEKETERSRL